MYVSVSYSGGKKATQFQSSKQAAPRVGRYVPKLYRWRVPGTHCWEPMIAEGRYSYSGSSLQ